MLFTISFGRSRGGLKGVEAISGGRVRYKLEAESYLIWLLLVKKGQL
ncbi:hypothetical protein SAMN05421760_10917 [Neptunomonas antarctica]|uniref:Uncharacterized protein n=1 Tax=Neptunomonas antarctica TaxID=619304 RepID=A0A1N7NCS9_9GAMM|nr:hypothetical protein SAMN05421760_10917 [Neptunomonas antarctica]